MIRDAEATRGRIIEAAVDEFAARGVAGARVDRIAAAARSNKQLIYQYFGDKDGLFRAVLAREMARAAEGVELSVDDFERFAGRYFDFAMANPRLMRLVAWCGLEVDGPVEGVPDPAAKLARIAEAQRAGRISGRFAPEYILSTVVALATAWVPHNWYGRRLDPDAAANAARYRESIVRAIALMTRP